MKSPDPSNASPSNDENVSAPPTSLRLDAEGESTASYKLLLMRQVLISTPFIVPAITAIVLAVAADRGFDFTDEGLYVLSYMHPREYLTSSTQFQLPIGAIWSLWPSLPFLRLVKLGALLASGAWLGRASLRYASYAMGANLRPLESNIIVSAITASALAPYVWLPQTPGYNDLTVVSAYVLAASVLSVCSGKSPWWAWIAVGSTWWILFLSKWPAAVTAVLAGAMVVLSYAIVHRTMPMRSLAIIGAGASLAVLATQIGWAPVGDVIRGIGRGSADLGPAYSTSTLIDGYRHELAQALSDLVVGPDRLVTLITLLAAIVSAMVPKRLGHTVASMGFVSLISWYWRADRLASGAPNIRAFSSTIFAICFLAALYLALSAAVRLAQRRTERHALSGKGGVLRPALIIASLTLAPFVTAVGTLNPILVNAVLALPFWLSAVVMLAALGGTVEPSWARVPVAVAGAIAIVTCSAAILGTWYTPYRQVPLSQADVELTRGPLRGLRTDATSAAAMHAAYDVANRLDATAVVALWKLPGLVASTDRLQPSYGWLPSSLPSRASASLSTACASNTIVLVMMDRAVSDGDAADIATSCAEHSWRPAGSVELPDAGEIRILVGSRDLAPEG